MIFQDEEDEKFYLKDKVASIINLLTKFKIKLWELPSVGESSKANDELIMKLSDESGLIENEVKEILMKLQTHSIKKFEDNKRFSKEGLAVFKIKIIGNNNQKRPRSFNEKIEIPIHSLGSELKAKIIQQFGLDCDDLKLICNGRVVKDDSLLQSQDIKNHSTLMAMCVYSILSDKLNKDSADFRLINDIKEAVSVLTDQKLSNESKSSFKLSNQNGRSLEMSEQDTRCLTTAMILHEKAKLLIKSKEFIKALILLAEADNEFKNCADLQLLEKVDNYALLNLDIVWCYLSLQNLHELKNAEERIQLCERCLEKCYGKDLQRLASIKTESINKHTGIFVRLNLLKGILNYHKGKKKECKYYLDMARGDLAKIVVDQEKLLQVMSMGFTSTEARLALRASFNDVDKAVDTIFKKKQLLRDSKKQENEEKKKTHLTETYGLTQASNQPIDAKILNDIMQFGYSEKKVALALIKADNNFNLALDFLEANLDDDEDDETTATTSKKKSRGNDETIDDKQKKEDLLSTLVSMGYDADLAKLTLDAFGNNLQKILDYFLENRQQLLTEKNMDELRVRLNQMIELNSNSSSSKLLEAEAKKLNARNLFNSLAGEIGSEDDEAYLDFNTEEDEFFIKKYYSLLDSTSNTDDY